jgi:hypothetical protein
MCSERSPEGAKYLSPGRSPGEGMALTPSRSAGHPSPARAGEGKGEREDASTHGSRRGLRYVAPPELNFSWNVTMEVPK